MTFGGISKEAPLTAILNVMEEEGISGTFFVTERELQRNDSNIRLILARGHELGIGISPKAGGDSQEFYMA